MEIETLALSGQPVPGAPDGARFGRFVFVPALNDAGEVVFSGTLEQGTGGVTASNDRGLWIVDAERRTRLIAREGSPAPGGPPGSVFASMSQLPVLNDRGQVAFTGFLRLGVGGVTFADSAGVWGPDGSSDLTLLAREGNEAPGEPAGAIFDGFNEVGLDGSGRLVIRSVLRVGPGGVTTDDRFGSWQLGPGEGLQLLVRPNAQAPDLDPGITFRSSSVPAIGGGAIAFTAFLGFVGFLDDTGIWVSDSGASPVLAFREGEPAPGLPTETLSGFGFPILNREGRMAFSAQLRDGFGSSSGVGLWTPIEGGGHRLLARTGMEAVGAPPGAVFGNRSIFPALNGAGRVAFRGGLERGVGGTTNLNDSGIWVEGPDGNLELVALEGTQAPGLPPGAMFGQLGHPVLNVRQQLAFFTFLQGEAGGVTFSNDAAIFAVGTSGEVVLVAREGGLLEVSPGEFETIRTLFVHDSLDQQVGRRSLSNAGELAFKAEFTDGTSGIFVATLPGSPLGALIDIKPGRDPNPLHPSSGGVIPVAILGSDTFGVEGVDVTTLAFGPAAALPVDNTLQDVSEDGVMDLVSNYRTAETGIAPEDVEACVTGETSEGLPFEGCDAIRVACDVDRNQQVDIDDTDAIFAARGSLALGPDDPMDANGDGIITISDGRICVLECTNPVCVPDVPASTGDDAVAGPCGMVGIESAILLGFPFWLRRRRLRAQTRRTRSTAGSPPAGTAPRGS